MQLWLVPLHNGYRLQHIQQTGTAHSADRHLPDRYAPPLYTRSPDGYRLHASAARRCSRIRRITAIAGAAISIAATAAHRRCPVPLPDTDHLGTKRATHKTLSDSTKGFRSPAIADPAEEDAANPSPSTAEPAKDFWDAPNAERRDSWYINAPPQCVFSTLPTSGGGRYFEIGGQSYLSRDSPINQPKKKKKCVLVGRYIPTEKKHTDSSRALNNHTAASYLWRPSRSETPVRLRSRPSRPGRYEPTLSESGISSKISRKFERTSRYKKTY